MSNIGHTLISLPFASMRETAQSRRYHWKNDQRGTEPFVILQWTLEGEGLFEQEGRQWPVPEDHAFLAFVPERSSYAYPPSGARPWVFTWLNFYGPLAQQLWREFRQAHGPVIPLPRRSNAGAALRHLIEQTATRKESDPFETSAASYQFLMDWSRLLQTPSSKRTNPVEMAMRICQSRFHESLGIKQLAGETGLTREHFTRLFTAETGVSPAHYLRRLRLKAARTMLRDQSAPRKEVALRCGFASVRALNRALLLKSGNR